MLHLNSFTLRRPNTYTLWSVVSIIVMGFMIALVIGSSYYIYDHVYRTLTDANTIVILNSAARVDDVNISGFDKARQAIDTKMPPTTSLNNVRNIFSFVSSTPAVYASSTTSSSPGNSTKK